ncbi:ATP synthase subunit I [Acidocella sp.]|uniref:N-ATPase subunit AtpR n=1 Tax=Acidocella sp. TaxID=50710 RepID=UPI0025BF5262|nr:ATP synthase subunit I [Acidocella sp.]
MSAALYPLAGFCAGLGYFYAVWRSALAFTRGGAAAAVGLALARLALLGGLLALAGRHGALALLLTALGVLAARPLVLRRYRVAA